MALINTVICQNLDVILAGKTILKGVAFRVEPGSIMALVGSNGAGKTSLLRVVATLYPPSSGDVMICGRSVTTDIQSVRQMIGYISSEERSFYWRLTARQNLKFFAALYGIHGREGDRRINDLLHAVGLEGKAHVQFQDFSSGMKQALCIARGLLHDPPVLLLDEPTRSLSPDAARKICELMRTKARKEGKTILMASHNLNEVEDMADQVGLIREGKFQAAGSIRETGRGF